MKYILFICSHGEVTKMSNSSRNLSSAVRYVEQLLQKYNKLQVVRVDLSYRKEHAKEVGVVDARRDLQHLLNNRRCKPSIFQHCVGHIAKIEHAHDKGVHLHLALLYDGSKVQKDAYYGSQIGDYWRNEITHGTGLAFNCNAKKDQYKSCGIGKVCRNDEEKRQALVSKVLSYLTKADQSIEDVKTGRQRCFTRGIAPNRKK